MNDENTTPRETPGRCVELNLSGQPCGLKAVQGRKRCYIHGIYWQLNDGRCSIDVPLLEDEPSILFVYSQVARALAQGSMPAVNANGIIRCCNGALKLLTEKRKHERFEERKKRSAEHRTQRSATEAAAHAEPDEADGTVPPNLEISEGAHQADSDSTVTAAVPDARSETTDTTDPANTMQAASENESAETDPEPHPWTVEPVRKTIPPPQFAGAREKFDNTLARLEGDMMMSLIERNRAVRARGGKGTTDGVICDIRDNFGRDVDSSSR